MNCYVSEMRKMNYNLARNIPKRLQVAYFKGKILTAVRYVLILVICAIYLLPVYVLFITSLKKQFQIMTDAPQFIFAPTMMNYGRVLSEFGFFRYLSNSLIIVLASTFLSLIVASLAAYGLARFRFKGRGVVSLGTLLLRMIPPAVIVIPLYVIWQNIGLLGTRFGLVLVYTGLNLPFTIWVLVSFISDIPIELEEAAIVDGCSPVGILFRIIMPLIKPGFAAASVFVFRIAWNEFMLALVLTDRYTQTLPVATTFYITDFGVEWGNITAMGTIIALPAILFTLVAAKQLITGLTAGAVKE